MDERQYRGNVLFRVKSVFFNPSRERACVFHPHVKGHVNESFFLLQMPPCGIFTPHGELVGMISTKTDSFWLIWISISQFSGHFVVPVGMETLLKSLNLTNVFNEEMKTKKLGEQLWKNLLTGTRAGRVLDSYYRANSCLELSSSWFQTQSNISTFQFIMYFFALFIGRFIIINIGLGWKNWNYAQTSCNVFLAVEGVTFSVKTPLVVTNQKTIVTNLFTRVL